MAAFNPGFPLLSPLIEFISSFSTLVASLSSISFASALLAASCSSALSTIGSILSEESGLVGTSVIVGAIVASPVVSSSVSKTS